MKKFFPLLIGVAFEVAAVGCFPGQAFPQTGFRWNSGTHGVVGHGNFMHARRVPSYFPKAGPYGYGNYGTFDRWRHTPHWHYYPSGVYRQGSRLQYVQGHYEWHQAGPIPGAIR